MAGATNSYLADRMCRRNASTELHTDTSIVGQCGFNGIPSRHQGLKSYRYTCLNHLGHVNVRIEALQGLSRQDSRRLGEGLGSARHTFGRPKSYRHTSLKVLALNWPRFRAYGMVLSGGKICLIEIAARPCVPRGVREERSLSRGPNRATHSPEGSPPVRNLRVADRPATELNGRLLGAIITKRTSDGKSPALVGQRIGEPPSYYEVSYQFAQVRAADASVRQNILADPLQVSWPRCLEGGAGGPPVALRRPVRFVTFPQKFLHNAAPTPARQRDRA